ncbi:MAG TPA: DUF488 domain-containing protein [Chloroflexota bacterium]|nr:DUF488 domain-containing protein [Chloroflexota bacterium]
MIQSKRVYDRYEPSDGMRILVERLWPRGIRKDTLQYDQWLKDVAPSAELRRWFAHDPTKWDEFRRRYCTELGVKPTIWQPILEAGQRGTVTLLYSARDTEHNNARALKEYLEQQASASASGRQT